MPSDPPDSRNEYGDLSESERLWRALITDTSDGDHEEVGWTACWENRSLATEAAYYYAVMNHLAPFKVATYPYEGERSEVGKFSVRGYESAVYIGFGENGEPLPHSANCVQYAGHLSFDLSLNGDGDE